MRIKKNDLLPYFIREEKDLPRAYVASCNKFFKELGLKQEATSHKPQASSLTDHDSRTIKDLERNKL
jgi:hypothetical protein